MNKYPRVGSIMFQLNEKGEAVKRVKVLKEDKDVGGIRVVDFIWLKHQLSLRDVQDTEIDERAYLVSLSNLSK